ncbi:2OG-Fe(II) oxygenase [Jeongeupia naejangsanensis]|uniref:2OG-Fe(II) oxygenase n=1 Tax=Jeongeupia naejangsanensis TaxID=613195 RepID=A0ABS2BPC1_9NEIS|nr:2OG-Fe(II) oxygenase [Jeongeupia naejangsanensis]MBM3117480.1 2OG-Fe(II) oxygenase [Jeongeupia naejangsanensis]
MSGFDCVVNALVETGWCVLPGFLTPAEVAALVASSQARRGDFARAGVGRAGGHAVNGEIRGDEVLWLDDADPAAALALARLDALRGELNAALYLGLAELECHLAVYPAGRFYKRHLDQHRGEDTRVVTIVLYLNPEWGETDGGELRLYLDDGSHTDVVPHGGTLAVFMSDRFEHEVKPAQRERWSLTGWFRRRAL